MIKPWIFDIFSYTANARSEFTPEDCQRVYDEYLQRWSAAEGRGFEGVFFSEHHFSPFNLSPSPNLLIAAVAQRTSTLRLGVMCNVVPLHDPRRLAEECGMLDYLTHGRLEIGLGLGSGTEESVFAGVDPAERRPRYQSGMEVFEAALAAPTFSHHDEFWNFTDVPLVPRPRSAHPPIWVTSLSTGSAEWAGRHGYKMTTAWLPIAEITAIFDAYRKAAEANGHRTDPDQLGLRRRIFVAESQQEAEDMVAQARDAFLEGSLEGGDPYVLNLLTRPDDLAVGTPDVVAESLIEQARQASCGHILMWTDFRLFPPGGIEASHRLLAEHVIPKLRSADVVA